MERRLSETLAITFRMPESVVNKALALEGQKDAAYRERDQLIAALSKVFPSHLARHEGPWEEDWRNIVCVHLPTGQATWHVHDGEMPLFAHLPEGLNHWDGHTTEEKYERLRALQRGYDLTTRVQGDG